MRAVVLHELNGEVHVGLAALALRLVEIDGLAVAGRLRNADGARDGGLVDLGPEVLFDLLHDLHGQVQAAGEHREDHALNVQIGVILLADGLQGADELRQTFQRIILALDWDQHTVAGAQTVQRQQVQAGRAVDEDEVIGLLHLGQRLAQAALAAGQVDHLQARARQPGVGADDVSAELGVPDGLPGARLADEHLIRSQLDAPLGDAVAGGGVALRVQIHDEHLFAQRRNTGRQIDGRGRFAHAAFLVCNCNYFCHARFLPLRKTFCSTWNIRGRAAVFPSAGPFIL